MIGLRRNLASGFAAAALLTGGFAPLSAQSGPPPGPAPAPTPAPAPQMVSPRGLPQGELDSRWQFDAAQKLGEQANLFNRYRQAVTFAECAQRVTPSRVANLLAQPIASASERRAANSLMRFAPGCLGDSVLLSTRLLRGAVAEAVLEDYKLAEPDRAREINSTRMNDFLEATPAAEREKDETAKALAKLTQCQVMLAPGLARKLLDVAPETRAEVDLRGELAEGTALCGRVEAQSEIAWLVHRSYLAEALYHWTRSGGSAKS
jgi:hypothetical protein